MKEKQNESLETSQKDNTIPVRKSTLILLFCLCGVLAAGTGVGIYRNYRSQDREFVGNVFFLTIAPLASAMMETLRAPEQWEHQRALLGQRLQIIRMGAVAPAISE